MPDNAPSTARVPTRPKPGTRVSATRASRRSYVEPIPAAERTYDIALILHADHELNASTFAARVIAGTMADMRTMRIPLDV